MKRSHFRQDEHGKLIVWEDGDHAVSVNSVHDARYVAAWRNGRKIGEMTTRALPGPRWLWIGSVEVDAAERKRGLGTKLYQALITFNGSDFLGVASYAPDQANKRAVPRIYAKLGAWVEGAGDYFFVPNSVLVLGDVQPGRHFLMRSQETGGAELFKLRPPVEGKSVVERWDGVAVAPSPACDQTVFPITSSDARYLKKLRLAGHSDILRRLGSAPACQTIRSEDETSAIKV